MAEKYGATKVGDFVQERPQLGNVFLEDHALGSFLRRLLPDSVQRSAFPDLERFGERCGGELAEQAWECEVNPPVLERYDGWGKRVDAVRTCPAWRSMKDVCAEEGLVAIAYQRPHGEFSRLVQAAKLLMFGPSSGLYSCPLAMTDGAAKVLEEMVGPNARGTADLGLNEVALADLSDAYRRLVSRDPGQFVTSGQWMTERRGGSDVADGTDTYAVPNAEGPAADGTTHRLHGFKWFTSATDADLTMTLARPVGPAGAGTGNKGLAMYFLRTRNADGSLNGLSVEKLKQKLGTRQLPTGELVLDGARATQISATGAGIPRIMALANLTRYHNAVSSAGGMRRILLLCRDYAHRRKAFGHVLHQNPLHMHTLAQMEVETRGATALALEVALLLGRTEAAGDPQSAKHAGNLLRILTPLAKLLTAKQAVAVASEGVESFGGAGYLEDTGLPRMLRDAQVLPIWEGTTNVNALDVFRSIMRSRGATLQTLASEVRAKNARAREGVKAARPSQSVIDAVTAATSTTEAALGALEAFAVEHVLNPQGGAGVAVTVLAREFALLLARTYTAALLSEHAAWTGASEGDAVAARRWAEALASSGLIEALQRAVPPPTTPVAKVKSATPLPERSLYIAPSVASATTSATSTPAVSELERVRREDRLLVMEGWRGAPGPARHPGSAPRSSL